MKTSKLIGILLILVIIISMPAFNASAEDNIKVLLNGEELAFDVTPQLINSRTMVPMRVIFEALGAKVEWVDEIQTIYALLSPRIISLKISDPEMYIMDASLVGAEQSQWIITLDVPPTIINGRTLVPVRAVSEAFGAVVEWDGNTQTVMIRQETEVDINNAEVQELFNSAMNGEAFMSYFEGYADISLFDSEEENFSWMGGRIRELLTVLSLKDVSDKEYTDAEANKVISQFLSKSENHEDKLQYGLDYLKTALNRGEKFGVSASEARLVAVYNKSEIDGYSKKLFGIPLPKSESTSYSLAYLSFFLYNRTNIMEKFPSSLPYILYYNEANEEYLFMYDLSMLSIGEIKDYLDYYNEYYEPLKSSTNLLRATKHNDEISLYVYREAEFGEYNGGTGVYKGKYRNTYKKGDNGYYWVSSYGTDEYDNGKSIWSIL